MHRRRFTTLALAAPVAALHRARTPTTAHETRPDFRDLLDLSRVDELYLRTFQMPATFSDPDQPDALYWVAALGVLLPSPDDLPPVRDAFVPVFPQWYVAGTTMTLGTPYEASLGGQVVGEGSAAWYLDVANPDDPDESWRSFAIGCTAVWSDRRLLMLWGASAIQNPVAPLIALAAAVHPAWGPDAASLVPTISYAPMGMVVIDEGPLHPDPDPSRPGHPTG